MTRKVLIITQDTEVTRRIMQEAQSLSGVGYDVSILMRSIDQHDLYETVGGIPVHCVGVLGRDPRFGWLYRLVGVKRGSQAAALWGVIMMRNTFMLRALSHAIEARADIYHARDLNNLLMAFRSARANGAKVVYDAHELFPDVDNRWIKLRRRSWLRAERELMPEADLSITVNELIAEEMARRNNVPPPLVVLNCPDPPPGFDPSGPHNIIRDRLGLPRERKIVLYHGLMAEGRGLDYLVKCAPLLKDGAIVVLLGYGDYIPALERMAGQASTERVYFLPAVGQGDLLTYCASADLGVIPIQAKGLNYVYTSPNRLYDYIQAAVPIVANDLPYLRKVIVGEGLGVVALMNSPETYAEAINKMLALPAARVIEIRRNLLRVAPQYTWQAQAKKLIEGYARI